VSVSSSEPSRKLTVRDPYSQYCDRLGPAGFVMGYAPVLAIGNNPPTVEVRLTPGEADAYERFMLRNETKDVATFALGTLQSETAPPGVTHLYAFLGPPRSFVILVRNPRARQATRTSLVWHWWLSPSGSLPNAGIITVIPD
jgi:hypothetical protein